MRNIILTVACYTAFCATTCNTSLAQEVSNSNALGLLSAGSDCIFSTQIYNRRLSIEQITGSERLDPKTTFTFINDLCEDKLIRIGIFGAVRELKRIGRPRPLGHGGTYTDGDITVQIKPGAQRFVQQCDLSEFEKSSDVYLDVVTVIRRGKASLSVSGTLMWPGCP